MLPVPISESRSMSPYASFSSVVARWQFESERDAGGHVGEEPRVNALDSDVAESAPVPRYDFVARGAAGRLEIPIIERHFALNPPIAVEHVLNAGRDEARSDSPCRRYHLPEPASFRSN